MMVQVSYQPFEYTARLIDDRKIVAIRIYRDDAPFPFEIYDACMRRPGEWFTIPSLKELP